MPDAALALVARAAEGSMRDAQSALDQVMAFAGTTITVEDVSTVLGLVGRDLLFDLIEAVADEDGPRAFALADRAVESGHDLKLVMPRPGARGARHHDPVGGPGARRRRGAGRRRAGAAEAAVGPVLARGPAARLRRAGQGRAGYAGGRASALSLRDGAAAVDARAQAGAAGRRAGAVRRGGGGGRVASRARVAPAAPRPHRQRPARRHVRRPAAEPRHAAAPRGRSAPSPAASRRQRRRRAAAPGSLKDALLAEIRAAKAFFYNTVVAQAQSIDVSGDRVAFTFLPTHRTLREQFEQTRPWIEAAAERIAGRKVSVRVPAGRRRRRRRRAGVRAAKPAGAGLVAQRQEGPEGRGDGAPAVQAVLEVFPAEIKDVEEL